MMRMVTIWCCSAPWRFPPRPAFGDRRKAKAEFFAPARLQEGQYSILPRRSRRRSDLPVPPSCSRRRRPTGCSTSPTRTGLAEALVELYRRASGSQVGRPCGFAV
jgi:hypothetical protein